VENKGVLESLTSALSENYKQQYEIVHKDSPDGRGIDVALIYKRGNLEFVRTESYRVELNDKYPTRDVMQVVLKTGENEINLFINHWPSRRGGQDESEKNRVAAAKTLRAAVDKLFQTGKSANVIIMGDFNDEPANVSIIQTLDAKSFNCDDKNASTENGILYNLASKKKTEGMGTYLYRSEWNMLDQIIVSGSLINGTTSVFPCDSFVIYKPDFIVQKEGNYAGSSLPTFGGKRYFGGYSDHFPVYAVFILN
jgi:predicted extracellular nuclease